MSWVWDVWLNFTGKHCNCKASAAITKTNISNARKEFQGEWPSIDSVFFRQFSCSMNIGIELSSRELEDIYWMRVDDLVNM